MTVPFKFRLHHCREHGHYHFITGPEDISWPFWSRESGLAILDFVKNHSPEDMTAEEAAYWPVGLEELRGLVIAQSWVRNFGPFGRFQRGYYMPRKFLPGEREVAESWGKFRRGEVPYMGYVAEEVIGTLFLPLYCDFVGRDEPRPDGQLFTRSEWIRLAEKPARIVTMAELGLAA
jgi:hypothetical protein